MNREQGETSAELIVLIISGLIIGVVLLISGATCSARGARAEADCIHDVVTSSAASDAVRLQALEHCRYIN